MTPAELQDAMLLASRELQTLIDDHPRLVREDADASRASRLSMAKAFIRAEGKTVAEKEANRDIATADDQHAAHMAQGLRESNKLAINAAMSRLSALQSAAAATREELKLARTGSEF